MLVRILMKDLSFSWPLQNPRNSEMLLQPHFSEALAEEQEDENGKKRHKVLWIAKVLGKTVTPKQQWRKSEIDFDRKQLFHSFLKQSLEICNGCLLSIQSLRLVYEQSLFWSISLVPSNSFKTDLLLMIVPAVCNKTCCIAPLPSTTWEQQAF